MQPCYGNNRGALPPGLSFDSTTGIISGKPTSAGSYTFEISATDDCGVLGIFVEDPPYTITVQAPAKVPDTGLAPAPNYLPIAVAFLLGTFLIGTSLFLKSSKARSDNQPLS